MKYLNIIFLVLCCGFYAFAVDEKLDFDHRVEATKEALFVVIQNEGKSLENFITQKEAQQVIRVIHRDQLTAQDLIKLKLTVDVDLRYQKLSAEQQIDLDFFLRDISFVRSRMSEFENFGKMHCRYALRDNPMDEVADDSVSKSPEKYKMLSNDDIAEIKSNSSKRAVVGFCWNEASHDPFNAWTELARKNQFHPVNLK